MTEISPRAYDNPVNINDALNRTTNLVATAIVSLSGFAFFPEFFVEDEFSHKLDEGLLFLLGLAALGWYIKGRNRFSRSVMPCILVSVALAIKVMGFFLELKDKQDLGDDIGALILFTLATCLVVGLYIKNKKYLILNN